MECKMKRLFFFVLLLFNIFPKLIAQPDFREEAIFPLQDKHVHSSSIVECPNGDLLVCWFHGSGERTADDVVVQGARLKRGAKKWSKVFLMADTPGFPDCNPVLYIDSENRLWLFWITVLAHRWERSILKYRLSTDYQNLGSPRWDWQDVILLKPGDKFAQAVEHGFKKNIKNEPMWAEYAPPYARMLAEAAKDPEKRQTGWMTRTHPIALPSGRILLPLYSDGFNIALVAISDDLGKNWRASRPIVGLGPIQPSIVKKKDGTIVAFLRDSGEPPNRVMISNSKDDGETWTFAVDINIPNPSSSLEVINLIDERWLMVYNDTENGRHSLAAALSDNEGKTWKWKQNLKKSANQSESFAYPSLIQDKENLIHLTYSYQKDGLQTIKHVVFNLDWIVKGGAIR